MQQHTHLKSNVPVLVNDIEAAPVGAPAASTSAGAFILTVTFAVAAASDVGVAAAPAAAPCVLMAGRTSWRQKIARQRPPWRRPSLKAATAAVAVAEFLWLGGCGNQNLHILEVSGVSGVLECFAQFC